jgi:GntR family transcriptional regulator
MIRLELDHRGRVPIYQQIVEQVKQALATGALAPGLQLPTVREVAAELRVNFNTVARAYRLLHDQGVISTQRGRGTYVVEGASPEGVAGTPALADLVAGWLAEADRRGYRPHEALQAMVQAVERPDGPGQA